jgi:methylglyoxal synthase
VTEDPSNGSRPKTLVGVLASRGDPKPNNDLVDLLTHLSQDPSSSRLENYRFAFTGGTHDRIFSGTPDGLVKPLEHNVAEWLKESCGVIRLPSSQEGAVTVLAYLVTQRQCSIVWPFLSPHHGDNHWLRPENLALMRLCDQWRVKRLMNRGSVLTWFALEAEMDATRNLQTAPYLTVYTASDDPIAEPIRLQRTIEDAGKHRERQRQASSNSREKPFADMAIALIAHDEMKSRMIEFAIDHEAELSKFGVILATGTTGREVAAATSRTIDTKMIRYHSGPKGGDIEIATAILYGYCDVVVFFIDPLSPHPHLEDIRVVFEACMVNDRVVMITNEMHAREFMSRVVRGRDSLPLFAPPAE